MAVSRLALAALVCVVLVGPAAADPVGTIGVYFDPAYTQSSIQIPGTVFTPTNFYVVVKGIEALSETARLKGYEFSLSVPADFTVTARAMSPPTSIDVGAGNDNWVVGTGACILPTDGNVLVVTYTYLVLAAPGDNLFLEFGAASPSSFDPPFPGWLDCDGLLYPFASTVPGRVNPIACGLAEAGFDGTEVLGLDDQGGEVFRVDVGKDVAGVLLNDFDGNGDDNILYWTASDGVEAGTLGQLDCQGGEVWSYTSSGLACQPTDGIVDVVDVQVGEFYAAHAGDEILVTALDDEANDVPVTRLSLLGLDGSLLGPSGDFEYWVLGRMTERIVDTNGTPALLLAGTGNATGQGLALRVPLSNLRGAGPDPSGTCFSGAATAVARWTYVLGANNGTTLPYFQAEDAITATSLDGSVLTLTGSSGDPYELDRVTLQPLACELAAVRAVGDQVSGVDAADAPLWTLDFTGSTVRLADLVTVSGAPVAVIALGDGGPYPNAVLAYECHGKPASIVQAPVTNCAGDGSATLTAALRGPAGTSAQADVYATYTFDSGRSSVSWLTLGTNVRTWAENGDLQVPGAVQQMLFGADGQGGTNLYLGLLNADAGGFTHVVAFEPTSVGGSIEPLLEIDCGGRQYLWSSLFDGLGFPFDDGDILSMQVVLPKLDPHLEVVTSHDTYLLSLADGTLIGEGCGLDPVEVDFGTVLLGAFADRDVTLTNTGAFQLTGTLTGCAVVEVLGDANYDLAPGQDQVFTLRFTPPSAGVHECFLDAGETCGTLHTIGVGQDPSATPTLSVESVSGLAAGGEFTLHVTGSSLGGVAGLDGRLLYDGAAFEFIDATLGSLLVSEGGFTGAFNGETPGEMVFALASAQGLPLAPGAGEVLDVTFRVAADAMPGNYSVGLSNVQAFDELAGIIEIDTADGLLGVLCRLFDVTGDGEVYSNDAIVALRIDVGLVEGTPAQICAADIDGNGQVEANDAVAILRHVVGLPVLAKGAALGAARLSVEGPLRRGDDGSLFVDVRIEAAAPLAGLDLTLALDGGRLTDVTLAGEGESVQRHQAGQVSLAAAAAQALSGEGIARLTLRIEGVTDPSPLTLRVLEGQVFGADGERADVTTASVELGVEANAPARRTRLFQNQPNPFNPRTEIRFTLGEDGPVALRVYDVAGRVVRTLIDETRSAGEQAVVWDGLDQDGRAVSSGVYLYRLETREGSSSRRMILVR